MTILMARCFRVGGHGKNRSPDTTPEKEQKEEDTLVGTGNSEGLAYCQDDDKHVSRTETRRKLIDLAQTHRVILVRGPVSSGKTSLVQLFGKGDDVVKDLKVQTISLLEAPGPEASVEKWEDFWYANTCYTGVPGWPWSRKKDSSRPDPVGKLGDDTVEETLSQVDLLVIDEIQVLYGHGHQHPLWKALKYLQQAKPAHKACVILFGVHGFSRSLHLGGFGPAPITFKEHHTVDMSGLRYTESESTELFEKEWKRVLRLRKGPQPRRNVWLHLKALLLALTDSHPGLLHESLQIVYKTFFVTGSTANFTVQAVEDYLLSLSFFSGFHSATTEDRSRAIIAFPSAKDFPDQHNMLRMVTFGCAGKMALQESVTKDLIANGILVEEKGKKLGFVCPLVEQVMRYSYAKTVGGLNKDVEPNREEFELLMQQVISCMDLKKIRLAKNNEAMYAYAFYEALLRHLPHNVHPFMEVNKLLGVSGGPDLVLDVCDPDGIPEASYCVQFLYNSRGLKEHAARVADNGKYTRGRSWDDVLVIDFTTVKNPKVVPLHTWRVRFELKHPSGSHAVVYKMDEKPFKIPMTGGVAKSVSMTGARLINQEKKRKKARRKPRKGKRARHSAL